MNLFSPHDLKKMIGPFWVISEMDGSNPLDRNNWQKIFDWSNKIQIKWNKQDWKIIFTKRLAKEKHPVKN